MKKIAFSVLALGVVVSGCDYRPGSSWRDNCEANASYDSYEHARCLDKVTRQVESKTPGAPCAAVVTDAGNADRPGWEDLGKGGAE